MEHQGFSDLNVPPLIASPADVSRLHREVQAVDDYLRQQKLRAPGGPQVALPKISHLLYELATSNGLNLLDEPTRKHLLEFLADVAENAPVIHISFAVDPPPLFLQKIVLWFRQQIHPSVLVRVGLEPTIAVGCIVRTTNRYYDLSLREYFKKHRDTLMEALKVERQPA